MEQVMGNTYRDILMNLFWDAHTELRPSKLVSTYLQEQLPRLWGEDCGRWSVISVGKAAIEMARGAASSGISWRTRCCVTKYGYAESIEGWEILEAAHPLPDHRSLTAASRCLSIARACESEKDRCLLLLSGGTSSLLVAPVEGLSFEEKTALMKVLLTLKIDIHSLNLIRKQLSQIKRGGWARALAPGHSLTLAISDVPGDIPSSIGSGISVIEREAPLQALQLLREFGVLKAFPGVQSVLERKASSSPKEHDVEEGRRHPFEVLLSNAMFLQKLSTLAERAGYEVSLFRDGLSRPLDELLCTFRAVLGERKRSHRSQLYVWGGEPLCEVTGTGKGGRMQHLALGMCPWLSEQGDIWMLALGTDGTDGPTDAAGAFVGPYTVEQSCQLGVDVMTFFADFDSYTFHQLLQTQVKTGATNTHVGDVVMFLCLPS